MKLKNVIRNQIETNGMKDEIKGPDLNDLIPENYQKISHSNFKLINSPLSKKSFFEKLI